MAARIRRFGLRRASALTFLGLALVLMAAAGGEGMPTDPRPEVVSTIGERPVRTVPSALACTEATEPANFRLYSLGASFEGLPLTTVIRRCDNAPPAELVGLDGRANYVSFIYGDCQPPPGGDAGCAPPLEVQVWPACERSVADYPADLRPSLTQRRGVPSAAIADRIELYADSTVVIFANDRGLADRAVSGVQPTPGNEAPATTPPELEQTETLPSPPPGAVSGKLGCAT